MALGAVSAVADFTDGLVTASTATVPARNAPIAASAWVCFILRSLKYKRLIFGRRHMGYRSGYTKIFPPASEDRTAAWPIGAEVPMKLGPSPEPPSATDCGAGSDRDRQRARLAKPLFIYIISAIYRKLRQAAEGFVRAAGRRSFIRWDAFDDRHRQRPSRHRPLPCATATSRCAACPLASPPPFADT